MKHMHLKNTLLNETSPSEPLLVTAENAVVIVRNGLKVFWRHQAK